MLLLLPWRLRRRFQWRWLSHWRVFFIRQALADRQHVDWCEWVRSAGIEHCKCDRRDRW